MIAIFVALLVNWHFSWLLMNVPIVVSTPGTVELLKRPLSDRHQASETAWSAPSWSVTELWLTVWDQLVWRFQLCSRVSGLRVASSPSYLFLSAGLWVFLSLMFSVSQPQSNFRRSCCDAIMSTGRSTRLLNWSWAASWAQKLPGGFFFFFFFLHSDQIRSLISKDHVQFISHCQIAEDDRSRSSCHVL